MNDRTLPTDQYVTEKLIREQQAEIERLRDRLESSGLRRLNADLERDAAVDDVAHLAGAIVGYVRARRDGLGEVAHWWWELQQIANEIAAPRVASGASIAGVSPSPAPLAPQSVEALRDYAVLDGERLQSLWAEIDRVKRELAEARAELATHEPWRAPDVPAPHPPPAPPPMRYIKEGVHVAGCEHGVKIGTHCPQCDAMESKHSTRTPST